MRRICTGMAALAASLVITCAPAGAETIRFGGILPLTGPGALIGTAEMRGVQFAVDQANAKGGVHGNQIEVLFEDNQAKPDQSILSFNKLTDLQHVSVIFTGYSGPTLAMAPLATRKKVLLVNAGAQADGLAKASPYLINTLPTIGGEIEVISRWAGRRRQEEGRHPVRERRRRHGRPRRLPEVLRRGRRDDRGAGGHRSSARPISAPRC